MSRILLFIVCCFLLACQAQDLKMRETGALTGGALGAGLGAIVGNQTGSTGAGIAIGAAMGGLAGGVIGNEFDNQNEILDQRDTRIQENQRTIDENQRIISELRRRGADVQDTRRGVVVNLPDVLFDFNRSNLKQDAKRAVREISEVVNQFPGRRIAVEGHTDSIGTIAYNQRLSEDRAYSVANELVSNGTARSRISARGYGETDPIASNSNPDGRARNRRVEVIIEN